MNKIKERRNVGKKVKERKFERNRGTCKGSKCRVGIWKERSERKTI